MGIVIKDINGYMVVLKLHFEVLPLSSLKVSSILVCSELFPLNSVLSSKSSSSKRSTSFCRDFLNQGPLSWSERRSGMGNRTTSTSWGAFTDSATKQCAGLRLSSRKTSAKALCWWQQKYIYQELHKST